MFLSGIKVLGAAQTLKVKDSEVDRNTVFENYTDGSLGILDGTEFGTNIELVGSRDHPA